MTFYKQYTGKMRVIQSTKNDPRSQPISSLPKLSKLKQKWQMSKTIYLQIKIIKDDQFRTGLPEGAEFHILSEDALKFDNLPGLPPGEC